MVIYIDIDQTICKTPVINGKLDYSKAEPIQENITKANKLYDGGNEIVYWTSRGVLSKIDYIPLTVKQLLRWGVKYNEVKFEKPYYDLFIDDKALNVNDWKNE